MLDRGCRDRRVGLAVRRTGGRSVSRREFASPLRILTGIEPSRDTATFFGRRTGVLVLRGRRSCIDSDTCRLRPSVIITLIVTTTRDIRGP